jgi:hypothetical protein
MQPLPGITQTRFSLIRFRSPLLTESRLFSLPAGTEMFHFPAFPPHTLCVQVWVTPHDWGRVSPFGNSRISARLTAPLDFSQSPTSFIGSWCQDIHRMPLLTCYKDARIHCAVLKEQSDTISSVLLAYPANAGGSSAETARSLKDTKSVFPQDPTAYRSVHSALPTPFHAPEGAVLTAVTTECRASQHPLMSPPGIKAGVVLTAARNVCPRSAVDAP